MIPTATLFTKTRNRRRHFMQLRSNPDFIHGDFEMFSRVWRSIESLFLTSGLRKNYAREVSIRSVPQYQISPNFLFRGLVRGGRTRKIGHYAKIRYGRGKDITVARPWFKPKTPCTTSQDLNHYTNGPLGKQLKFPFLFSWTLQLNLIK